jgi:hypothetical protein
MLTAALALHVALVLPPSIPRAVARGAVAEAAAVWAPYGVAIEAGGPGDRTADDATRLDVVIGGDARLDLAVPLPSMAGLPQPSLGSVTFTPDGVPAPIVTVYLRELQRVVAGARLFGAAEPAWPSVLRECVVGRVLGRVLAHEIGHYVLRMPRHSAGGLMRPLQVVGDLVSPTREHLTLSPLELRRLSSS